jgi:LysM repeat protein
MPEITLSLPIALLLLTLILGVGAILLFIVLRGTGRVTEPTITPTPLFTSTPSLTPTPLTPTPTSTPLPTPTPFDYNVAQGDTCSAIAYRFQISIQSLILLNNLPADCGSLFIGQKIKIPQPTPTATALPTSTLKPDEATEAACEKINYLVQENDTLSAIAGRYAVPMAAVREYNGLTSDNVFSGTTLLIPLCRRAPTPGPSPTPSPPPPYPAPNLLLPADGSVFSKENTGMTLQWASVGTLRENESYAVSIENLTEGEGKKKVYYVKDTKQPIPVDILPKDNQPHVFRWKVEAVRQTGTDDRGEPIWETAGAASNPRVFIGYGTGSSSPQGGTPIPQP